MGARLLQLRAMHCQRAMTRRTGGRLRWVQAMQALCGTPGITNFLEDWDSRVDRYVGQSGSCFVIVGLKDHNLLSPRKVDNKTQGQLRPKATGPQGKISMHFHPCLERLSARIPFWTVLSPSLSLSLFWYCNHWNILKWNLTGLTGA